MAVPLNHIIVGIGIFYCIFSFVYSDAGHDRAGKKQRYRGNYEDKLKIGEQNKLKIPLNKTNSDIDNDLLARDLLIYIKENNSKKNINIFHDLYGDEDESDTEEKKKFSEKVLKKYNELKKRFTKDLKKYLTLAKLYKTDENLINYNNAKKVYHKLKHSYKYYKIIYIYFTNKNYIKEKQIILPPFDLKPPKVKDTNEKEDFIKNKLIDYKEAKKNYVQNLKRYYNLVNEYRMELTQPKYKQAAQFYDKLKLSYEAYKILYEFLSEKNVISESHIPLPAFYIIPPEESGDRNAELTQKQLQNYKSVKTKYLQALSQFYTLIASYHKNPSLINYQKLKYTYTKLQRTYFPYKESYDYNSKVRNIIEQFIALPPFNIVQPNETSALLSQEQLKELKEYEIAKNQYIKYLKTFDNLKNKFRRNVNRNDYKYLNDFYTTLRDAFQNYIDRYNILFLKKLITEGQIPLPAMEDINRNYNTPQNNQPINYKLISEFNMLKLEYVKALKTYMSQLKLYQQTQTIQNFQNLNSLYRFLSNVYQNYRQMHLNLSTRRLINEKLIPIPQFNIEPPYRTPNPTQHSNAIDQKDNIMIQKLLREYKLIKSTYVKYLNTYFYLMNRYKLNPNPNFFIKLKRLYQMLWLTFEKYKRLYQVLIQKRIINESIMTIPEFKIEQPNFYQDQTMNIQEQYKKLKLLYLKSLKEYISLMKLYQNTQSKEYYETIKRHYDKMRIEYMSYKKLYEYLLQGGYINEKLIPLPSFNITDLNRSITNGQSVLINKLTLQLRKLKILYIQNLKTFLNSVKLYNKYSTIRGYENLQKLYKILIVQHSYYERVYKYLLLRKYINEKFIPLPRFDVKPVNRREYEINKKLTDSFKKNKYLYMQYLKQYLNLLSLYRKTPTTDGFYKLKQTYNILQDRYKNYKEKYDLLSRRNMIHERLIPLPSFEEKSPIPYGILNNYKKQKILYGKLLKNYVNLLKIYKKNPNKIYFEKLEALYKRLVTQYQNYKKVYQYLLSKQYINENLIVLPNFITKSINEIRRQRISANEFLSEFRKQKQLYIQRLKYYKKFLKIYQTNPNVKYFQKLQKLYQNLQTEYQQYSKHYLYLISRKVLKEKLIPIPPFVTETPDDVNEIEKNLKMLNVFKKQKLLYVKHLKHYFTQLKVYRENPNIEDFETLSKLYKILKIQHKKYDKIYGYLYPRKFIRERLITLPKFHIESPKEFQLLHYFKKLKLLYVQKLKQYVKLLKIYRENSNIQGFKDLMKMYKTMKNNYQKYKRIFSYLLSKNKVKEELLPIPKFVAKRPRIKPTKRNLTHKLLDVYRKQKSILIEYIKNYFKTLKRYRESSDQETITNLRKMYKAMQNHYSKYKRTYKYLLYKNLIKEKLITLPKFDDNLPATNQDEKEKPLIDKLMVEFKKIKFKYTQTLKRYLSLIKIYQNNPTDYDFENLKRNYNNMQLQYRKYKKIYKFLLGRGLIKGKLIPIPPFIRKIVKENENNKILKKLLTNFKERKLSYAQNLKRYFRLMKTYQEHPTKNIFLDLRRVYETLQKQHKIYRRIYHYLYEKNYINENVIPLPRFYKKLPTEITSKRKVHKLERLIYKFKEHRGMYIYNLKKYINLLKAYRANGNSEYYNTLKKFYEILRVQYMRYKKIYDYLLQKNYIRERLIPIPNFKVKSPQEIDQQRDITSTRRLFDKFNKLKSVYAHNLKIYLSLVKIYQENQSEDNFNQLKRIYYNLQIQHKYYKTLYNYLLRKNYIKEGILPLPDFNIELPDQNTSERTAMLIQKLIDEYKAYKLKYAVHLKNYFHLLNVYIQNPSEENYNTVLMFYKNLQNLHENYKKIYEFLSRRSIILDTLIPLPSFPKDITVDNSTTYDKNTQNNARRKILLLNRLKQKYSQQKLKYVSLLKKYFTLKDLYEKYSSGRNYNQLRNIYMKLRIVFDNYKTMYNILSKNNYINDKFISLPLFDIKQPSTKYERTVIFYRKIINNYLRVKRKYAKTLIKYFTVWKTFSINPNGNTYGILKNIYESLQRPFNVYKYFYDYLSRRNFINEKFIPLPAFNVRSPIPMFRIEKNAVVYRTKVYRKPTMDDSTKLFLLKKLKNEYINRRINYIKRLKAYIDLMKKYIKRQTIANYKILHRFYFALRHRYENYRKLYDFLYKRKQIEDKLFPLPKFQIDQPMKVDGRDAFTPNKKIKYYIKIKSFYKDNLNNYLNLLQLFRKKPSQKKFNNLEIFYKKLYRIYKFYKRIYDDLTINGYIKDELLPLPLTGRKQIAGNKENQLLRKNEIMQYKKLKLLVFKNMKNYIKSWKIYRKKPIPQNYRILMNIYRILRSSHKKYKLIYDNLKKENLINEKLLPLPSIIKRLPNENFNKGMIETDLRKYIRLKRLYIRILKIYFSFINNYRRNKNLRSYENLKKLYPKLRLSFNNYKTNHDYLIKRKFIVEKLIPLPEFIIRQPYFTLDRNTIDDINYRRKFLENQKQISLYKKFKFLYAKYLKIYIRLLMTYKKNPSLRNFNKLQLLYANLRHLHLKYKRLYNYLANNNLVYEKIIPLPPFNIEKPIMNTDLNNSQNIQERIHKYEWLKQVYSQILRRYMPHVKLYRRNPTPMNYKNLKYFYRYLKYLYNDYKTQYVFLHQRKFIRDKLIPLPSFDIESPEINRDEETVESGETSRRFNTENAIKLYRYLKLRYMKTLKEYLNYIKDYQKTLNLLKYNYAVSSYSKLLNDFKLYKYIFRYLSKMKLINGKLIPLPKFYVQSPRRQIYSPKENLLPEKIKPVLKTDKLNYYFTIKNRYLKALNKYYLLEKLYQKHTTVQNYRIIKGFHKKLWNMYILYKNLYDILYSKVIYEKLIQFPRLVLKTVDQRKSYFVPKDRLMDRKEYIRYKIFHYKYVRKRYETFLRKYQQLLEKYKKNPTLSGFSNLEKLHEMLGAYYNDYRNLYDYLLELKYIKDEPILFPNFEIPKIESTNNTPEKIDRNQMYTYLKLKKLYADNLEKYYELLDTYESVPNELNYKHIINHNQLLKNIFKEYKIFHQDLYNKRLLKEKLLLLPGIPEKMAMNPSKRRNFPDFHPEKIKTLKTKFNEYNKFKNVCLEKLNDYQNLLKLFNLKPNLVNYIHLKKKYSILNIPCKLYKLQYKSLQLQYNFTDSKPLNIPVFNITAPAGFINNEPKRRIDFIPLDKISNGILYKNQMLEYQGKIDQFRACFQDWMRFVQQFKMDHNISTGKNAEEAFEKLKQKYMEYLQLYNELIRHKIISDKPIIFPFDNTPSNITRNEPSLMNVINSNNIAQLNSLKEWFNKGLVNYLGISRRYKLTGSEVDYNNAWIKYNELKNILQKYMGYKRYLASTSVIKNSQIDLKIPFSPDQIDFPGDMTIIIRNKPYSVHITPNFNVVKFNENLNAYRRNLHKYDNYLKTYMRIFKIYKQRLSEQLFVDLLSYLKKMIVIKNNNKNYFVYLKEFIPALQSEKLPEIPEVLWLIPCFNENVRNNKKVVYRKIYNEKISQYFIKVFEYNSTVEEFSRINDINHSDILYHIFKQRENILEIHQELVNIRKLLQIEGLINSDKMCNYIPPLITFDDSRIINLIKIPEVVGYQDNLSGLIEKYKRVLVKYYFALAYYHNNDKNMRIKYDKIKCDGTKNIENKIIKYKHDYQLYQILVTYKTILNALITKILNGNNLIENDYLQGVPDLPEFLIFDDFVSCFRVPKLSTTMSKDELNYLNEYYNVIKLQYILNSGLYDQLMKSYKTLTENEKIDQTKVLYEKLIKIYDIYIKIHNYLIQRQNVNQNFIKGKDLSIQLLGPPKYGTETNINPSKLVSWVEFPIKREIREYEPTLPLIPRPNDLAQISNYYNLLRNLLQYYSNMYRMNLRLFILNPTNDLGHNLYKVEYFLAKIFREYFNKYFKLHVYLREHSKLHDSPIPPFYTGIKHSTLLPVRSPNLAAVNVEFNTKKSKSYRYYKLIKLKYQTYVKLYKILESVATLEGNKSSTDELRNICHDVTEAYLAYNNLFIKLYKSKVINERPLKLECKLPNDGKYNIENIPPLPSNPTQRELKRIEKYFKLARSLQVLKLEIMNAHLKIYHLLKSSESKYDAERAIKSAKEIYAHYSTVYDYLKTKRVSVGTKLLPPDRTELVKSLRMNKSGLYYKGKNQFVRKIPSGSDVVTKFYTLSPNRRNHTPNFNQTNRLNSTIVLKKVTTAYTTNGQEFSKAQYAYPSYSRRNTNKEESKLQSENASNILYSQSFPQTIIGSTPPFRISQHFVTPQYKMSSIYRKFTRDKVNNKLFFPLENQSTTSDESDSPDEFTPDQSYYDVTEPTISKDSSISKNGTFQSSSHFKHDEPEAYYSNVNLFLNYEKKFDSDLEKYFEKYDLYTKNESSKHELKLASKALLISYYHYYNTYMDLLMNENSGLTPAMQKRYLLVPHYLIDLILEGEPVSIYEDENGITGYDNSIKEIEDVPKLFGHLKNGLLKYINISYDVSTKKTKLRNILKALSIFNDLVNVFARYLSNYDIRKGISEELNEVNSFYNLLTLPNSIQRYLLYPPHNHTLKINEDKYSVMNDYKEAKIQYYEVLIEYIKSLKQYSIKKTKKLFNDALISYIKVVIAQKVYFSKYIEAALNNIHITTLFPRYPAFFKISYPDSNKKYLDNDLKSYYTSMIDYYTLLKEYYQTENSDEVYGLLKRYSRLIDRRRKVIRKMLKMQRPTEFMLTALRNFPVFSEKLKKLKLLDDQSERNGYKENFNLELYYYYQALSDFTRNRTKENKQRIRLSYAKLLDTFALLYKDFNKILLQNYDNPFALSITLPLSYDVRKSQVTYFLNYLKEKIKLQGKEVEEDGTSEHSSSDARISFHLINQQIFDYDLSFERFNQETLPKLNLANVTDDDQISDNIASVLNSAKSDVDETETTSNEEVNDQRRRRRK